MKTGWSRTGTSSRTVDSPSAKCATVLGLIGWSRRAAVVRASSRLAGRQRGERAGWSSAVSFPVSFLASLCGRRGARREVLLKPGGGEFRDLLQRALLLEQMGGAGDDLELLLAGQPRVGLGVEAQHLRVAAAGR